MSPSMNPHPTYCPYCSEWPVLDEESGQFKFHRLYPEEILTEIALGLTTLEICERHKAPVEAIEHIISMIPFMMVWRDQQNEISNPVAPISGPGGTEDPPIPLESYLQDDTPQDDYPEQLDEDL